MKVINALLESSCKFLQEILNSSIICMQLQQSNLLGFSHNFLYTTRVLSRNICRLGGEEGKAENFDLRSPETQFREQVFLNYKVHKLTFFLFPNCHSMQHGGGGSWKVWGGSWEVWGRSFPPTPTPPHLTPPTE